jgi:hypothetical protein
MWFGQASYQLVESNIDMLFPGSLQGFEPSRMVVTLQCTAVLCRVLYILHVLLFARPRI